MHYLPDLILSAAIYGMASGLASNIIINTPIGQVILSKTKSLATSVLETTYLLFRQIKLS